MFFHIEVVRGPHDEAVIIAGGGQGAVGVLYLYDGVLTLSKRQADLAEPTLDIY